MPLTPLFFVTPLNNHAQAYADAAHTEELYNAWLTCFGVWYYPWGSTSNNDLEGQYTEDKATLAWNAINGPAPSTLPMPPVIPSRLSMAYLLFKTNATTADQYLMIIHARCNQYFGQTSKAAIYLNGNLIASEVDFGSGTFAFVVHCPPPQTYWHLNIVLQYGGEIEFKGIECYKL